MSAQSDHLAQGRGERAAIVDDVVPQSVQAASAESHFATITVTMTPAIVATSATAVQMTEVRCHQGCSDVVEDALDARDGDVPMQGRDVGLFVSQLVLLLRHQQYVLSRAGRA
nr:hypothetical protein [Streptomyces sp. GESEQ-35]